MSHLTVIRPTVINPRLQRKRCIYVGRWDSTGQHDDLMNPIRFCKTCPICRRVHDFSKKGREEINKCYRVFLWMELKKNIFLRWSIRALRGLLIGCDCPPSFSCHAEILADCCVYLWSDEGLKKFPIEDINQEEEEDIAHEDRI